MDSEWILILIGAIVISFIFGWLLSRLFKKSHYDGAIFIEPTEDGERERIRFILEMDLDEIKQKPSLLFKINVTTDSQ